MSDVGLRSRDEMKTTCCAEECDENPAWKRVQRARHENTPATQDAKLGTVAQLLAVVLLNSCAVEHRGWEKKTPTNSKSEAWKSGAKSPTTHESQCLPLPTKKLDLLIGDRHVAAHVSYLGTCSRPRRHGRSARPGFPMH